jgi:hypothetical protein
MFPDADINAGVLYMPCTFGCFFYDVWRRKGGSVQIRWKFGFGRRVGGWEWEHEVTLGYQILYPQNYDNYMWLFGAFDAGFFMSKLQACMWGALLTVI